MRESDYQPVVSVLRDLVGIGDYPTSEDEIRRFYPLPAETPNSALAHKAVVCLCEREYCQAPEFSFPHNVCKQDEDADALAINPLIFLVVSGITLTKRVTDATYSLDNGGVAVPQLPILSTPIFFCPVAPCISGSEKL